MDKIKQAREERNSAIETLEQIQNEFGHDELDSDATEKWNEAKATIEKHNKFLDRVETLENNKYSAIRNNEDGEDKQYANFSMREALLFAKDPNKLSDEKRGFYSEVSQEGERQARNSGVSTQGGFVVPSNVMKNAVDVSTEGSDLLFDQPGGFIDALRDKLVLTELGVRYLDNLSGDVRMPKLTGTSTFGWQGETTEASGSDTAYGNVTLSPKRGHVEVPFSNQMLAQESLGMEQLIRDDIFSSVARGIEAAAINAGTTNGPNGILDISSAVTSIGSGSGDFYKDVVNLEAEVTGKNVRGDNYAYLLTSALRGTAKQSFKDAGSGMSVWEPNNMINGYKAGVTNAVTANQLIFGNFSDLIIGDFGGMELIVDPYTQASAGITKYLMNVYVGVAIRHDEAFAHISYA